MRTNIFLISITLILVSGSVALSAQSVPVNWSHSTGSEFLYTSYLSILDLSFIAAEGSVSSFNSRSEWSFNYRHRFDYHSILGWSSFNALGGRYQYNAVPHFIFGLRGALDKDRFITVEGNWFDRFEVEEPFMRKSGRYGSDIDYGLKGYGDLFFKPLERWTWGIWNSVVLADIEPTSLSLLKGDSAPSQLSFAYWESPQLYLQSTPRVIYELKGDFNRLVVELYMDNRFYLLGAVDLEGSDYFYFFKIAFVPQWIVNWKGRRLNINSYSAASVEVVQHTDPQLVFKTSPSFSWEFLPFRFGISGGGYEFRDEIGIIFDNNEILGLKFILKQTGSVFSFAFSPKAFIAFDVTSFLSIGAEASYRGGLSIIEGKQFYLEELFLTAYLQSEIALSEKWSLFMKGGFDHILGTSLLDGPESLPGETIIRFSLNLLR